jgi:N-methylhydantoinase A
MHAVFIARELEINEVVIPPNPGAFSAWGMLETEVRRDFSQSYYQTLADAPATELTQMLRKMEAEAYAALAADGIDPAQVRVAFSMDMRYAAQEYTLTVPIDGDAFPDQPTFVKAAGGRFDQAHDSRFGHANPGAPIEIVTLRAVAFGAVPRPEPVPLRPATDFNYPFVVRKIVFDKVEYDTPVIRRDVLKPGMVVTGPAVVLEQTATTVLPPNTATTVEHYGSLIVHILKQEN